MEVVHQRSSLKVKSNYYKSYISGGVTRDKFKWDLGPVKTDIQNPWIAHVPVTVKNADRRKSKGKQNRETSTSKESETGATTKASENMSLVSQMEANNILYCYPVYPNIGPMLPPGFSPMMPPGFSPMLPLSLMTPQYGCATSQQSHQLQPDVDVPPHLRVTPAKMPLQPDLQVTATDPREERVLKGVYGAPFEQPERPFELPGTSLSARFIAIYRRTMKDHTFHESGNSIGRHQPTSGNSSDSEISLPFEPLDNPNSSPVLITDKSGKAAKAWCASSSGKDSDASTSIAGNPTKNVINLCPVRREKRMRRESVRIDDRNETVTKRKKVAPIVITLNRMKTMESKSAEADGEEDSKKKKSKHKHSKIKAKAQPFISSAISGLLLSDEQLFPHPIYSADGFDESLDADTANVEPVLADISTNVATKNNDSIGLADARSSLSETTMFSDLSDDGEGEPIIADASPPAETKYLNVDAGVNIVNPMSNRKCKICSYESTRPTFLVTHYVRSHPDTEVLISRLSKTFALLVVEKRYEAILAEKRTKHTCPFCEKEFALSPRNWTTHFTHHTGEFEYTCDKCSEMTHMRRHRTCRANATKTLDFALNNGVLKAFMCRLCNFAQLRKSGIEKHIRIHHEGENAYKTYERFDILTVNERNEKAGGKGPSELTVSDDSTADLEADLESLGVKNDNEKVDQNKASPHEAETGLLEDPLKSLESKSASALLEAKENFPIREENQAVGMGKAEAAGYVVELSSDESNDEAEKPPPAQIAPNMGCHVLSSDEE